jgi:hypothetical protein
MPAGRFGTMEEVGIRPSGAALSKGRQQFMDLAGDGNLDVRPHPFRRTGTRSSAPERTKMSDFAQEAKRIQSKLYPELDKKFRWGGYYGRDARHPKYGDQDEMHFDLGGDRIPMGGGSWKTGRYDHLCASQGMVEHVKALREHAGQRRLLHGNLAGMADNLRRQQARSNVQSAGLRQHRDWAVEHTHKVAGDAHLRVDFSGMPKGVRTSATTSGDLFKTVQLNRGRAMANAESG